MFLMIFMMLSFERWFVLRVPMEGTLGKRSMKLNANVTDCRESGIRREKTGLKSPGARLNDEGGTLFNLSTGSTTNRRGRTDAAQLRRFLNPLLTAFTTGLANVLTKHCARSEPHQSFGSTFAFTQWIKVLKLGQRLITLKRFSGQALEYARVAFGQAVVVNQHAHLGQIIRQ